MCISLESPTPLSFTLFITPSSATALCLITSSYPSSPHFSISLSIHLVLIFYLSANPNITAARKHVYTLDTGKHAWTNTKTHLHADTQACICIHKFTNSSTKTVWGHTHTHTLTVAVLSCTATHCVYAEPLSLLVECCYALLTSGEENIQSCPLVIHWCHNYPPLHLPFSLSEFVYCVRNR